MTPRNAIRLAPSVLTIIVGVTVGLFPEQSALFVKPESSTVNAPAPEKPGGPAAVVRNHLAPRDTPRGITVGGLRLSALGLTIFVLGLLTLAATIYKENTDNINDPGRLNEEKFQNAYIEAICSGLRLLPVISVLSPEQKHEVVKDLLKKICWIAEAYKNDNQSHELKLNACLYVPRAAIDLTPQQLAEAKAFEDPGRHTYGEYLVLHAWAFYGREPLDLNNPSGEKHVAPCVAEGAALPVDSAKSETLFGAPCAYVTGEPDSAPYLTETKKFQFKGTRNEDVRKAMKNFLADRSSYRSFVAIPTKQGAATVGVVSVQSSQAEFCNLASAQDKKMLKAMEPLLSILSFYVVHSK